MAVWVGAAGKAVRLRVPAHVMGSSTFQHIRVVRGRAARRCLAFGRCDQSTSPPRWSPLINVGASDRGDLAAADGMGPLGPANGIGVALAARDRRQGAEGTAGALAGQAPTRSLLSGRRGHRRILLPGLDFPSEADVIFPIEARMC
jgi:hypothetical protein